MIASIIRSAVARMMVGGGWRVTDGWRVISSKNEGWRVSKNDGFHHSILSVQKAWHGVTASRRKQVISAWRPGE